MSPTRPAPIHPPEPRPAPVSPRLVLGSIAAVWLAYFVIATARASIMGFDYSIDMLGRRLVVTLAAMLVTVPLWPVLRMLDPRPLVVKAAVVLALALPGSLAIAAINVWVFADIEQQLLDRVGEQQGIKIRRDEGGNLMVDVPDSMATPAAGPVAAGPPASDGAHKSAEIPDTNRLNQIADLALGRYFVLLAWAALYLAFANAEQARGAERREGEFRRAAKAAELRSLRYQVNPHFLFNTLNSLSALVMTGKGEAAERMIQSLSGFYRRSLAGDPTADIALEEEIDLQKLYLEIEAVRFPERLAAHFDIPPELARVPVPGMILQPLVENAVKYGVSTTSRPVTIAVTAREEQGHVVITVRDDGPGPGAAQDAGYGIGIANVRDRIAARFGQDASLHAGPDEAGGWRAELRLPLVSHA